VSSWAKLKINLKKEENFSPGKTARQTPQSHYPTPQSHHKKPSKNTQFSPDPLEKHPENGQKARPTTP
jgi:hypothetical protein